MLYLKIRSLCWTIAKGNADLTYILVYVDNTGIGEQNFDICPSTAEHYILKDLISGACTNICLNPDIERSAHTVSLDRIIRRTILQPYANVTTQNYLVVLNLILVRIRKKNSALAALYNVIFNR